MKKQFILLFGAILILSGCAQEAANPVKTPDPLQKSISKALDEKKTSQQTTDNSKENDRKPPVDPPESKMEKTPPTPNAIANERNNSSSTTAMQYIQQYDGAVLKTSLGDITIKFFNADSPKTVENFLKLADQKFYDGTRFHRVIKDFMIQGGDPNSKDSDWSNDGTGGPGYAFEDEFNNRKLVRGSLAMANSGPNTNGSQFFIVTAKSTPWLDGKHTNFGEVVSGMDVVEKTEKASVNENDHPLQDITVKSIELVSKNK